MYDYGNVSLSSSSLLKSADRGASALRCRAGPEPLPPSWLLLTGGSSLLHLAVAAGSAEAFFNTKLFWS